MINGWTLPTIQHCVFYMYQEIDKLGESEY